MVRVVPPLAFLRNGGIQAFVRWPFASAALASIAVETRSHARAGRFSSLATWWSVCRGFKSLKHIVKICFKQKQYKEMMKRYKEMLTYIKSAVTRNMSDKSINSLLEMVGTAQNTDLLLDFYQTTLTAAKDVKNDVCV